MNTTEFVKRYIFDNPIEEVSCPIKNNKCSLILSPTTVIVRNNDIFIIGDNRSDEKNKNKVILIKNINLELNEFDLSYMECISTEKFYLYLFTNNITPFSYQYGLTISLSDSSINPTGALFNDFNILEGYEHPPLLTLDKGNLAFKLKEKSSGNIKYIHHIIDFNLIIELKIKFEKREIIDANAETYKKYFSNQIRLYQEYYKEYLKIKAEQKEIIITPTVSESFLQKYKYYFLGSIIVILLIIIIFLYIKKKKIKNIKKIKKIKKKS
jgi:hypothetical protein